MVVRANFVDIYSQGIRDRSMRSGTELAREIKLTDWPMAGNLSNRSSGVQIPRDICTRLKRYLYSAKCSWIITVNISNPGSVGFQRLACTPICLQLAVLTLVYVQLDFICWFGRYC